MQVQIKNDPSAVFDVPAEIGLKLLSGQGVELPVPVPPFLLKRGLEALEAFSKDGIGFTSNTAVKKMRFRVNESDLIRIHLLETVAAGFRATLYPTAGQIGVDIPAKAIWTYRHLFTCQEMVRQATLLT